jgi:hypothetical protein
MGPYRQPVRAPATPGRHRLAAHDRRGQRAIIAPSLTPEAPARLRHRPRTGHRELRPNEGRGTPADRRGAARTAPPSYAPVEAAMPAGRPDRRRSRCGEGASLVAFDCLADDHLAGILGVATQAASHLLIANWRTLRGNLCAASPARLRSVEGTRRGNRAGRPALAAAGLRAAQNAKRSAASRGTACGAGASPRQLSQT